MGQISIEEEQKGAGHCFRYQVRQHLYPAKRNWAVDDITGCAGNLTATDWAVIHQVAAQTLTGKDREWRRYVTGTIGACNDSELVIGGNGPGPHISQATKGNHLGALSARKKAYLVHVEDAVLRRDNAQLRALPSYKRAHWDWLQCTRSWLAILSAPADSQIRWRCISR